MLEAERTFWKRHPDFQLIVSDEAGSTSYTIDQTTTVNEGWLYAKVENGVIVLVLNNAPWIYIKTPQGLVGYVLVSCYKPGVSGTVTLYDADVPGTHGAVYGFDPNNAWPHELYQHYYSPIVLGPDTPAFTTTNRKCRIEIHPLFTYDEFIDTVQNYVDQLYEQYKCTFDPSLPECQGESKSTASGCSDHLAAICFFSDIRIVPLCLL